jgi:SAM-dependent methyltransferase
MSEPVPEYFHHARPEVVARISPAGLRVLDVGCAAGAMGALMRTQGALEVVGLERDVRASQVARRRLHRVHQVDLESLPILPYPDGHFDVLTFADVLEHLVEPGPLLRHLRRYLRDDGRVVVSIPNVRHESVLLPLLVEGRFTYQDAGVLDRTHLRFFTLSGFQSFLRAHGFEPHAEVGSVRARPSPQTERLADTVSALGGDRASFLAEAATLQFLVTASPSATLASLGLPPSATQAPVGPDAWDGARPLRVLLAPLDTGPACTWRPLLAQLLSDAAVTVGLALTPAQLASPPGGLEALASAAPGELALVDAPETSDGWERLAAGASVFVDTGERPGLTALARKVGLEVVVSGR